MKDEDPSICEHGHDSLFKEIVPCKRKSVKWLFGIKYCDECFDALVKIHAKMNGENKNTF